MKRTLYDVLGVPPTADVVTIRATAQTLRARELDQEELKLIRLAEEILSRADTRARYDARMGIGEAGVAITHQQHVATPTDALPDPKPTQPCMPEHPMPPAWKVQLAQAESEKTLGMAIGLNLLLAGAGYIYVGRAGVGIGALLLFAIIILAVGPFLFWPTWLFLQVIMGIDMTVLWNKRKAQRAARETKQCPACAESVKSGAKLCRFCGHRFENAAE